MGRLSWSAHRIDGRNTPCCLDDFLADDDGAGRPLLRPVTGRRMAGNQHRVRAFQWGLLAREGGERVEDTEELQEWKNASGNIWRKEDMPF